MKPILLKAGVPIASLFAGFIFSMITTKRRSHIRSSSSSERTEASPSEIISQEGDEESFQGLEEQLISNTQVMDSFVSSRIRDRHDLEEEILRLKVLVSSIQNRELELERQVVIFCGLKEQELNLMEQRNMLVLELARVELLGSMIESMEAESRRLEVMVFAYLKVLEQLNSANLENSLLEMKVEKLLRTTRKRSWDFCRQASMIRAKESEVLRSQQELEQKDQVIKDLDDELVQLKRIVDRLQEEKKELQEKVELGETSAPSTSQIEADDSALDHEDPLLVELEQLRNVRVAEAEELIYLRWINACLRHELRKNQEGHTHEQEDELEQHGLEFEREDENRENNHGYEHSNNLSMVAENGEFRTGIAGASHKKAKLLQKLKKWVKGNEGCKRTCNEEEEEYLNNCFRRRSVSDEPTTTEKLIAGRKSCASA